MIEIVSVRFKKGGKNYYFNPNGMQIQPGQNVIIDTSRGVEFGECTQGNTQVDETTLISPLRPVIRLATEEDRKTAEANRKKEAKAFEICQQKIAEHGLDMKLVEVEYNFEGNKILFFFTSEGRVDFRELVKDLAAVFRTRIELRQIGIRDEAKMLGGLGVCGRPFCCSSFLEDFQPVSIKMAKTQNLSLNPTKISGVCGRLMCCLKYEQEAYEDLLKRAPKVESLVETPDGVGTVSQVNLLREKVKVRLDGDPDSPQVYPNQVIKVIRSGKGKRPEGYELPEQPESPAPTRLRRPAPAPASAPAAEEPTREAEPPQGTEQKEAPAVENREERPHRSRRNRGHGKGPRPEGEAQQGQERQERPEGAPQRRAQPQHHQPKEGGGEAGQGGEQRPHRNRPRRRRPRGNGGQGGGQQGKEE
jgi:cell fate regulator YaaT (PSP1 superfamily)